MHLSEGMLPAAHAVTCALVAAPFVWVGARQVADVGLHRVAICTALLFAVTLFPVPVPVVGMSSHMCAAPVLGLLLGPLSLVLPTLVVLLMQALFFGHGGISTLGANLLALGVAGPLAAVASARVLRVLRIPLPVTIFVACFLADLVVYAVATSLLATALAAPKDLGRLTLSLLLALSPAQLPLAVLEGGLSLALIKALLQRDAARIPSWLKPRPARWAPRVVAGMLLLFGAARGGTVAYAVPYEGLDERVFEAASREAGRPPSGRLDLGLAEGEVARAVFGGAMLISGFVLGRGWRRLERES